MKKLILISALLLFSFGCEKKENDPVNPSFSNKEIITSYPYCVAKELKTPCVVEDLGDETIDSGAIFMCAMGRWRRCCPELGPDEFFEDETCTKCADRLEEECRRDFKSPCIAIITNRDKNGTASQYVSICDQGKMNQLEELIEQYPEYYEIDDR